ncbi:calcium:proton antiporter [Nonomuraea sp. 10N515B]|uniref:calcium:proton antiporter n=1 Tax=Nonomuraea sp. 10N515B TaxID=3457422 RepID=UPI003FCCB246
MSTPPAAPAKGSPLVLAARIVPIAAVLVLIGVWGRDLPAIIEIVVVALLAACVLAAVHHAEVVAHRVGEPFGSLILAVAVTVIEVALIITLMISGGPSTASLARDTVFAAVMITCNGIVGLSLLLTALRTRTARFNPEGTGAALATVITLATLSLVLPAFTTSAPGPEFSGPQLAFAAVASLTLYVLFVFVQNIRHRDYFLTAPAPAPVPAPARPPAHLIGNHVSDSPRSDDGPGDAADTETHAATPPTRTALTSLVLLMAALVAVVGLAKVESTTIEQTITAAGLPHSLVGVVIALLVLLPETLAAARHARRNRTQISLNLALGSAMASIGLTIPAIAVASIWLDGPLLLGLGPAHIMFLALTAGVGILTVMPGRATLLQAGVHLALCAGYLFLAANP